MDQAKLDAFMGKMVGDLGAAMSAPLVAVGEKLGLYRAMAQAGPVTPKELAKATKTSERYVREWLSGQAAAGYVEYDAAAGRYVLPPEHALALADETSPYFVMGGFDIVESTWKSAGKTAKAFRTGRGVAWGEHDACLFRGTERFFGPSYRAFLVDAWLPALDGVVEKLKKGALVADVGCGHAVSTILMAKAFPNSRFVGIDAHPPSIKEAKKRARAAGVAKNLKFEVAGSSDFPGSNYDLVTFFDCFHDMGKPLAAARRVKKALAPDGTWMLVEPFAGDRVEDNLNPVGRCYYAASAQICVPASLSEKGGAALGAQAGEARIGEIVKKAGFTRFRRASATPFNLVLEARP